MEQNDFISLNNDVHTRIKDVMNKDGKYYKQKSNIDMILIKNNKNNYYSHNQLHY